MGRYVSKKVIQGHMTHSTIRREKGRGEYMEVLVFAGETAEGEPVGEWEMPIIPDYEGIAATAVRQTKAELAREETGNGS